MINVAPLVEARTLLNKGVDQILVQLKDTSIPLDERWDAYTQLVDNDIMIREMSYGDGFLNILDKNGSMYDDFNTDRGQTMTFPDMYEQVMQAEEEYDDRLFAMQANIDPWREQVLASGFSSFTYDW